LSVEVGLKHVICLKKSMNFLSPPPSQQSFCVKLRLKCDGTRAETIICLSAKRTNPFKSAGKSVQSTAEVYASAVVMLDTPCSEVV
jgi:hypothetical protein